MAQNRSSAVMQQRFDPHDSLEDYPTPPWGTRALLEHVIFPSTGLLSPNEIRRSSVWEPCANRGHMVKPLSEYFGRVFASDIHDYGMGYTQHDFLMPYLPQDVAYGADWIITNPPFRLAYDIIQRGIDLANIGVAVLVRSAFEEGVGRYDGLFSKRPPTLLGVFSERVIMHKGVLRDPSKLYLDERTGEFKRPSTATSYKWMVWIKGMNPRPQVWIGPCRTRLERPGDYVSRLPNDAD